MGSMVRLPAGFLLWTAVLLGAVAVFWIARLWSPERQAELHTLNLLERASRQQWDAVGDMMAPDFRDARGLGKAEALADAAELGRHFFSWRVGPVERPVVEKVEDSVCVAARLGVYGSGTPVAHAVIEAVHELEKPFVFRWRKNGGWPWQWALAELEQDELVARYPR